MNHEGLSNLTYRLVTTVDEEKEMESNKEQAAIFAAFSDPTRLRLIKILTSQENESALCVNALAGILGISQSAVSQHLRMLKNLGLVKGDRQGYRIHYEVNRPKLEQYRTIMAEALRVDEPK